MDPVNLPIPVFQAVMEELLLTVGLYRVFDFRLVSKIFDREILRAVFLTRTIDRPPDGLSVSMDDSLTSQYLRTRVLADRAGNNQLVNTIRRTMKLLSDEAGRHSEPPPDKYIDELCTVAVVQKGGYTVLIDLRTDGGPAEHQLHEDTQHLLTAAAYTGKIELLRALLEKSADVNTGSRYFGKPLQAAAYAGHTDVVLLLLEQGADVDDGGAAGWYTLDCTLASLRYGTTLQAASLAGHEHIVRLLVKVGVQYEELGK